MNLKNKSFISYKKDKIEITVRSDLDHKWIDSFLNQFCGDNSAASKQILYDKRNTITKINEPILKKVIAVKEFHLEKTYDQLRFRLLPSKAERSLKIARTLRRAGLKTPEPLALIEKRGRTNKLIFSYYISEYVDYDYNMLDIAKNYNHPEREKILKIMPQLGKEIRKMHDAGIIHNDLHAGNILVKEINNKNELYYIDLNRGRVKSELSDKERINDLKRLKFTEHEKEILFKNYAPD